MIRAISLTLKHKSFQNFLIMASIAVVQALNTILLGRYLSKAQFGLYGFVFLNIIYVLPYLFLIGQHTSIIRYFSSKNLEDYDWRAYLKKFFFYIIPPLILVCYGIKHYYDFGWSLFMFIVVGSLSDGFIKIISAMLRSRGKFNTAIVIERFHPLVFIMMLLGVILLGKVNFNIVMVFKVLSIAAILPLVIYYVYRWDNGEKVVDNSIFKDGIRLWEISMTMVVIERVNTFFMPKLLGYENLALYSVLIAIMQIYEFSRISLFNVYSQKFAKGERISRKKLFFLLAGIATLISVFYLLFTNILLHILFNGKYVASMGLVVLFCLLGSIKIMYVFPACFLVGSSNSSQLKTFFRFNLAGALIQITAIIMFGRFGLWMFVVIGCVAFIYRSFVGMFLLNKVRGRI